MTIAQFPHCDSRVLHRKGACVHCDRHPDWQDLREAWGINFTGEHEQSKLPCPSTMTRPVSRIHAWPGNRPVKEADLESDPVDPTD